MKFFAVILVAGIFAIPTSHAEVAGLGAQN
jgi:hypothetical protein